jgi:transposase-like protein
MLTKKQREKYVANLGVRCPYCGHDDTPADGGIQAEAGIAWQDIHCAKCERKWSDIYKLKDVEEI